MPILEKLSLSELPALDSSPNSVRERFTKLYGSKPDGIALNSETYFEGVNPAITEQYGHPCYKTLGPFTYEVGNGKPPEQAVVGYEYAVNYGNDPAEITLSVTGNWNEVQSWSSATTTSLTLSSKFTIEGVFESGAEFSVSTTVGQSSSTSVERSSSATVTVSVPPKSRKKVTMVGTMKQEIMNFHSPIKVQGMFGANFPSRVNGHYFWFNDASSVLNKTSGEIRGSVKNTAVFNVQTEIGESEPL
ncbi:hydralysin-2 [Paenibacillus tarimensis]|uniref:hydralysin-2 n=1 Tax=Paenibacillus tarimensis TaxID=416012 RepID=UPI001F18E490|nr:hydralysin-2 [Paenibacillus tarimensis]MCF2942762.1 hydralysin-2 [Paenibacillus tarimensis]